MHGHGAMPSERLQRPGVGAEGALGHHVGSPGGGMGAARLRGDAGGTHLSRPPAPKQGCTALHTKPRRARGACSVSAHCIRSLARQRAVHESHSQHGWKRPPTSSGATVHVAPLFPHQTRSLYFVLCTLYCSPTALCCRLRTPTAPLPSLDTLQGHSVSLAVRGQR